MTLYRIKDWDEIYENNRTRELKRLGWVPVPNSHDGEGYTLTACQPNGAALLGAWMVILQIASRCGKRGTLVRDTSVPHDARSISRISRLDEQIIDAALKWFASHEIQWLEIVTQEGQLELPHEPAGIPHPTAPIPHPTDEEGKGRERKEGKTERPSASRPPTSEWLNHLQSTEAYRNIPIAAEYDKAVEWHTKKRARLTEQSFIKFLGNYAPKTVNTRRSTAPNDGPGGWRDVLAQLYPDTPTDRAWITYPLSIRAEILAQTQQTARPPNRIA